MFCCFGGEVNLQIFCFLILFLLTYFKFNCKNLIFNFFKAGENEKKLANALKSIEQLTEMERKYEVLEENQKHKSLELSALKKDKELFNMETEV